MQAMTGLPQVSMRRKTAWPRRALASPAIGSVPASSLMSAPAAKIQKVSYPLIQVAKQKWPCWFFNAVEIGVVEVGPVIRSLRRD